MKIEGVNRSELARHFVVDLPVGFREEDGELVPVIVSARFRIMSLDFTDNVEAKLPPKPVPPKRPLRSRGKPERDEQGRPIYEYDERDTRYLRQIDAHNRAYSAAMFIEALDDPAWEFAATRPDDSAESSEWMAYYRAIWDEMSEFGLSAQALTTVANRIREMSGISDADIEAAKEGF